jgi:single-strand DNA-binding protein
MTEVTMVGNLTATPELKFIPNGAARATFTIAVSQRVKQGGEYVDAPPMFLRVTAWRELAEHIAESLDKGQRVIVQGRMKMRSYESDGETRQSWEIDAEEVGPSLRFSVARTERAARGKPKPAEDPWGTGGDDAPPF